MKLVIVTGASTGIGFESATRLAEEGFDVIACARREQDLGALKAFSHRIHGVILDVTEPATIRSATATLKAKLDAAQEVSLINNAGIAVAGPLEAISIADFRRQFDVNVFGLLEVTQAFLPWIRKTKGRIVNISSISGLSTPPFLGPYSASKHAVEAMSDALRRELAPFDVKVVVIEPGAIATPIWQKGLDAKKQIEAGLNPESAPLYREAMARFEAYVEQTAKTAISVSLVGDAVVDALKLVDPPTRRLVVSVKDRIRTTLAQWFPDRMLDEAIRKALSATKS